MVVWDIRLETEKFREIPNPAAEGGIGGNNGGGSNNHGPAYGSGIGGGGAGGAGRSGNAYEPGEGGVGVRLLHIIPDAFGDNGFFAGGGTGGITQAGPGTVGFWNVGGGGGHQFL